MGYRNAWLQEEENAFPPAQAVSTAVQSAQKVLKVTVLNNFFVSGVFSLTLGAHAQRGLLYLVCVSVCVSV